VPTPSESEQDGAGPDTRPPPPVSQRTPPKVAAAARCSPPDSTVARLEDMRQLMAWAIACEHLRACGLEPIPPDYVVRALKRRGWW
jgi:hypothetical protein